MLVNAHTPVQFEVDLFVIVLIPLACPTSMVGAQVVLSNVVLIDSLSHGLSTWFLTRATHGVPSKLSLRPSVTSIVLDIMVRS